MCEKVEKVTNGKQGRVNGVARERAKARKGHGSVYKKWNISVVMDNPYRSTKSW
jgi:hypothetical protein